MAHFRGPLLRQARDAVIAPREWIPALTVASALLSTPSAGADVNFTVETVNAAIESQNGTRLSVVFARVEQPALLFKPVQGAWNWSATSKLFIPVENPGNESLTLMLRIASGGAQSLRGNVSLAAHSAGDLLIWLAAPLPRSMGMVGGPSLRAAGLALNTLPVTATRGSIDASHVTSVSLGIWRPSAPQVLTVGPLRIEMPTETDQTAYREIVDEFGQFSRGTWPEKISSIEMLQARAATEAAQLRQWRAEAPKRDRYGGLVGGRNFGATGFFRTQHQNGRWWLVTPEGNPFFSIGMDVVAPWGRTYVEGREFMFCDVPGPEGGLARHWGQQDDRRGWRAQRGRLFDHGQTFDFYTANLERKFGADWRLRWREEASARLEAWGFNTIGNWSDPDLRAMHRLPYTVPLSPKGDYTKLGGVLDWWGGMPDPFDPRFADAADEMARAAAAKFRGDPYLIGYFVNNELSWGKDTNASPQERYAVAVSVLAGPESPAKSAFVAHLVETYREPERLARAWGVSLASWDALSNGPFALPAAAFENSAVISNLSAFSRQFAEAYFRTIAEALRRHDPDHLYLGSRFVWQTTEAVEACARWCDIVSFNRYVRSIADDPDEWARFHKLGKPAMIGEFHFGSVDRGLFWEGIVGVGKESERGPAYARYLRDIAENPDFVGAHWFQYLDEPLTGRTLDGENGHVGFVTVTDQPYEGLVVAARDANLAILEKLQRGSE